MRTHRVDQVAAPGATARSERRASCAHWTPRARPRLAPMLRSPRIHGAFATLAPGPPRGPSARGSARTADARPPRRKPARGRWNVGRRHGAQTIAPTARSWGHVRGGDGDGLALRWSCSWARTRGAAAPSATGSRHRGVLGDGRLHGARGAHVVAGVAEARAAESDDENDASGNEPQRDPLRSRVPSGIRDGERVGGLAQADVVEKAKDPAEERRRARVSSAAPASSSTPTRPGPWPSRPARRRFTSDGGARSPREGACARPRGPARPRERPRPSATLRGWATAPATSGPAPSGRRARRHAFARTTSDTRTKTTTQRVRLESRVARPRRGRPRSRGVIWH